MVRVTPIEKGTEASEFDPKCTLRSNLILMDFWCHVILRPACPCHSHVLPVLLRNVLPRVKCLGIDLFMD